MVKRGEYMKRIFLCLLFLGGFYYPMRTVLAESEPSATEPQGVEQSSIANTSQTAVESDTTVENSKMMPDSREDIGEEEVDTINSVAEMTVTESSQRMMTVYRLYNYEI